MGNNCSCLNDITSLCSEDLSRAGNNGGVTNYTLADKYDPINDINSINSNQKIVTKKKKSNNINKKIIIIKKNQLIKIIIIILII